MRLSEISLETKFKIDPIATKVTICHVTNKKCSIQSGEIWPIAVRGSKYKIQYSVKSVSYENKHSEPEILDDPMGDQRRIGMNRLKEFSPGPIVEPETIRLIESIRKYGNGPVTITSKGEAIMWRRDDNEWNPYYIGIVNLDPVMVQIPEHPGVNGLYPSNKSSAKEWFDPKKVGLWTGCMFKTGEPWTVRQRSRETSQLTWPGKLSSALSKGLIILGTEPKHAELIDAYLEVRPCGGRLYILLGGDIWMNVRKQDVGDDDVWGRLAKNMRETISELINIPNHPLLQMYNTRMEATRGDKAIEEGCLPIYLGNCADFDDGSIPITKIKLGYKRTSNDPNKIDGDEESPYSSREEQKE